jgi:hypothetical protein
LRAEEVAEELLDRLAEVGKKNRKLREKQEEEQDEEKLLRIVTKVLRLDQPRLDLDFDSLATGSDFHAAMKAIEEFKKEYRTWLDSNDIFTNDGEKQYSPAMKNAAYLEQVKYCRSRYIVASKRVGQSVGYLPSHQVSAEKLLAAGWKQEEESS